MFRGVQKLLSIIVVMVVVITNIFRHIHWFSRLVPAYEYSRYVHSYVVVKMAYASA